MVRQRILFTEHCLNLEISNAHFTLRLKASSPPRRQAELSSTYGAVTAPVNTRLNQVLSSWPSGVHHHAQQDLQSGQSRHRQCGCLWGFCTTTLAAHPYLSPWRECADRDSDNNSSTLHIYLYKMTAVGKAEPKDSIFSLKWLILSSFILNATADI